MTLNVSAAHGKSSDYPPEVGIAAVDRGWIVVERWIAVDRGGPRWIVVELLIIGG